MNTQPDPHVTVNGRVRSLAGARPYTSTLDYLRGQGLTGCKEGCAEGECGACAVLVRRPADDGTSRWVVIDSCLVPALSLDRQEIVTSEGIGTVARLHPVQREMARRGGSQCGYCTPGFVCSMAAEYYRHDRTPGSLRAVSAFDGEAGPAAGDEVGPNGFELVALSGNLCRCTGYRPIRDAAFALGPPEPGDPLLERLRQPPPAPAGTRVRTADGEFIRPETLADALAMLVDEPRPVVIAGCTDWGVEVNQRGSRADRLVAVDRLPELRELTHDQDALQIGAALTLSEIGERLAGAVPLLDEVFDQFASPPIRNSATLGGNIGTASPIGDAPPALLALDATVVLVSAAGERLVPLTDYFTGYRTSVRRPDELIKAVRIPLPLPRLTAFHKIAKRRYDDISSVAVAFAVDVRDDIVERASIGVGGVAATPIRAAAAESALAGAPWTPATVAAAARALASVGTPMDDHRASARYRVAMLHNSVEKFFAATSGVTEVRT